MSLAVLCLCFFAIAVLYSSAGFGGGSSYIALLIVAHVPIADVRFVGLICNIIVVSGACYHFYKADLLRPKELFPIVFLSIPFAFIGGLITPHTDVYKTILAVLLVVVAMIMLLTKDTQKSNELNAYTFMGIGGGIGFISGFIGIGGGIFLSPILHITRWNTAKKISAAASFFIFVNSIAGLIGQSIKKPDINWYMIFFLGCSVFLGGQIGNRMNIHILPPNRIKLITAVLIAIVGFRILFLQFS